MTQNTEEQDRQLVEDVVVELKAHLEVIAARREQLQEGSFDPDLTAAAASVSKVLLAGASERRQQAKARTRELAKFPLEAIVSYLKSLPESVRADVAKEITNADAEEPLL